MCTGACAGIREGYVDAELLAEPLELQHRRGPVDVGRNEQHALALAVLQPQRDLRSRRGLARTLQAGEQDHGGRLRAQIERTHALAHHAHEFVVDDLDERLARRQALVDFLADDACLHAVDEVLDHRQRHVGLEQRHPHLPQRVADVLFGEAAAAAQALDDGGKAGGKLVEHVETSTVAPA